MKIDHIFDMKMMPTYEGWTPTITDHLLGLEASDRRLRFLSSVTDEGIRSFCEKSRPHALIVAYEGERVVGLSEVHMTKSGAEIAVSVNADKRGMGIGGELFSLALSEAAKAGAAHVSVLFDRRNTAVRRMCERHGARVLSAGSEVSAVIRLRPAEQDVSQ